MLTSLPLHKNEIRPGGSLGTQWLTMAADIRTRVLQHRNDTRFNAKIRSRPTGDHLPGFTTPGGCDDCSRHGHQQDGASASTMLRPNAGSEMGY